MKKTGKMMGKRFGSILLAVAMLLAVVTAPFYTERVQAANPLAMGIDVSMYQGAINWQAVRDSGVKFAFVRVGNVEKGIDPYFAANMAGANAAGLRTGVYIYSYAKTVEEVTAEAAMVLNAIAPYTVSFPVVIDYEDNTCKGVSAGDQAAIVMTFCTLIAQAGYYPMVYSYRNWFLTRMGNVGVEKWVAQYGDVCDYPGGYTIWQASSHGSVKGINGRVDIDYLYKDLFSVIVPEGFVQIGDSVVYYRNYRKQFGWVDVAGSKYYCGPTGAVQTGWFADETGAHYLDPAQGGKMLTGLCTIGDGIYLLDGNGVPHLGWSGVWPDLFFFGPDGKMLINAEIPFNETTSLVFGPDGKLVSPAGFDPANPEASIAAAAEAAAAAAAVAATPAPAPEAAPAPAPEAAPAE